MIPKTRCVQSSQEREVQEGGSKAITTSVRSGDTMNPKHQSFLCHSPTPGILQSTLVTLRKLHMERHDKNHYLGVKIQKLRKNGMYVAKATLILLLYAYAL